MQYLVRELVPTNQNPFTGMNAELELCRLQSTMTHEEARHISHLLAHMDPWLSLGFSAEALCNYLSRDDPALSRYRIFHDEELIGVLCIRYPWLRGPYIELLGLEPNYQGKGIAKQIIGWIEQRTMPHAKNIWIAASSFNTRALSAYEKYGFQHVGSVDDLVTDGKSEIILRLRIPRI